MSFTGKKPAISDKVSFLLFCFVCFFSVLCLVFVLWKVPRMLTYLPSCLAALGPRGKVSDSGYLCVGTGRVLYDSSLFLIHPFSLTAGLLGSICPRSQSPRYRQPRRGRTEAAPCQGRSRLCQGKRPLLLGLWRRRADVNPCLVSVSSMQGPKTTAPWVGVGSLCRWGLRGVQTSQAGCGAPGSLYRTR